MKQILGVVGRAHAGKDSFAQALAPYGFRRLAFADALKEVTALLANEPVEHFHDPVLKEAHCPSLGMTRRRALQNVGQGMRQSLHDSIWLDKVIGQWREMNVPVVVSDVRYPNEAEAIRAVGGLIVRIERPGFTGLQGDAAAHTSEAGIPDNLVDAVIVNDGTLHDLEEQAARVATWAGEDLA
jgi:hypothetical protein